MSSDEQGKMFPLKKKLEIKSWKFTVTRISLPLHRSAGTPADKKASSAAAMGSSGAGESEKSKAA